MERFTKLDNNSTVITNYRESKTISLIVGVKYGAMHDSSEKVGLAHFFEHLMMSGSKKRPSMELVFKDLEKSGGIVQAATGKERTYIYSNFLSEELPTALDVCLDCLMYPVLNEDSIKKEKEVISKEIIMAEDSTELDMYQVIAEALYKNHPLGHPIRGTKNSVNSFAYNDLRNAHSKNYVGSNIIICAVGDVNHDNLLGLLSKYDIRKGNLSEYDISYPKLEGRSYAEHVKNSKQSVLSVGFQIDNLDIKKEAGIMVLDTLLASGPTSEIFKKVRTKSALAYGIKSGYDFTSLGGDWKVFILCQKDNISKIEELVISECLTISEKIDKTSLELIKSKLRGQIIINNESNLEQARNTFFAVVRGINNYQDKILEELKGIDSNYIIKLSKEIFSKENYAVGVIY